MSITSLTIAILATWRVTHLLWGEDGPSHGFVALRRAAGHGFWGGLLDCFYCLSLWIAAPIALWVGDRWIERGLLWLALSGGAILLERVTAVARPAPVARWHVDPTPDHTVPDQIGSDHIKKEDKNDVMLR